MSEMFEKQATPNAEQVQPPTRTDELQPRFDKDTDRWIVDTVDEKGASCTEYYDIEMDVWVKHYPYDQKAEKEEERIGYPKGPEIGDGNHRAYTSNS